MLVRSGSWGSEVGRCQVHSVDQVGGHKTVVGWVGEQMISVVASGTSSASVGEGSSHVMEGGGRRW